MTAIRSRPTPPSDAAGTVEAPLRATLGLARPVAGRLAVAALLGAGAIGAGIGLIATSAWLISRASQRPAESALAIAIVAVQFFGLSRGLFRYGQRLVGHDAAFRALADLRVRSYARLEALAPAGLPAFRSGDLLARLVHDIDSLQDLLLRVIAPFAIALLVGAGTVVPGVVDPPGGGCDPADRAAAGRDGADLADGRAVGPVGIPAGRDPGRAHGGRRGPDRGSARADGLRRARTAPRAHLRDRRPADPRGRRECPHRRGRSGAGHAAVGPGDVGRTGGRGRPRSTPGPSTGSCWR